MQDDYNNLGVTNSNIHGIVGKYVIRKLDKARCYYDYYFWYYYYYYHYLLSPLLLLLTRR